MIKYIYVPEEEEVSDYYDKASELNISQIVHGQSDIVLDFIEDYNKPSIIEIPEFTGTIIQNKISKEGSKILIAFVDEWIKQNSYESVDCVIYSIDIDSPWIKNIYKEINMRYDQQYCFFAEFTAETYGEYLVQIVANYKEDKKIICEDEIIVYKEYEDKLIEETDDFKFKL